MARASHPLPRPPRRPRSVRGRATGLALLALAPAVLLAAGSSLQSGTAATSSSAAPACHRPAHGFVPTQARIPAIGRTVQVIQVQRTSSGQVGAGPVTEAGKWLMAMDPQTKPGAHRGTVILSGHTWPDGSALGNAMLNNLRKGDGFVLRGKNGVRACYVVTQRTSYPANQVPSSRVFRSGGREQVVIVSCSGKRLGPGNWTRRTVWFASPHTPPPPPPPPAPSPPPSNQGSGSLLGGLLGGL